MDAADRIFAYHVCSGCTPCASCLLESYLRFSELMLCADLELRNLRPGQIRNREWRDDNCCKTWYMQQVPVDSKLRPCADLRTCGLADLRTCGVSWPNPLLQNLWGHPSLMWMSKKAAICQQPWR